MNDTHYQTTVDPSFTTGITTRCKTGLPNFGFKRESGLWPSKTALFSHNRVMRETSDREWTNPKGSQKKRGVPVAGAPQPDLVVERKLYHSNGNSWVGVYWGIVEFYSQADGHMQRPKTQDRRWSNWFGRWLFDKPGMDIWGCYWDRSVYQQRKAPQKRRQASSFSRKLTSSNIRMDGRKTPQPQSAQGSGRRAEEGWKALTKFDKRKRSSCFNYNQYGYFTALYHREKKEHFKPRLETINITDLLTSRQEDNLVTTEVNRWIFVAGTLNDQPVERVLLDTWAERILVDSKLIQDEDWTGEVIHVRAFNGTISALPLAKVRIEVGDWEDKLTVAAQKDLGLDALLGTDLPDLYGMGKRLLYNEIVNVVQTRSKPARQSILRFRRVSRKSTPETTTPSQKKNSMMKTTNHGNTKPVKIR